MSRAWVHCHDLSYLLLACINKCSIDMEVLIMEAERFITIMARFETTAALAPVALLLISAFCAALVGRRTIFLTIR